jgi:hypothetical protein
MPVVEKQGQVRSIRLPDEWRERAALTEPLAVAAIRTFEAPGNPHVQIRLGYRGRPESQSAGDAFLACLKEPVHSLSEKELGRLFAILRDMGEADQFQISSAQTLEINRKRALWVEGRWKDDRFWSGTLFIDADASGRVVQEITCFCDIADHEQFSQVFKDVLYSIQWL